jgi:hypothetical protein
MNPSLSLDLSAGTTFEVDGTPITLRLPAGAAIFTVRGEAWITQERMRDDVILGAGDRFDVPGRGPIVISATHGRADLFVAKPGVARLHPMRNVNDFIRSHARQLRDTTSRCAGVQLARALRVLGGRLRASLIFGRRATTH